MTREERLAKLRQLRVSIPISDILFLETLFLPWQGQVSALLRYNPKLQLDFQGAIGAIQQADGDTSSPTFKRATNVIRTILEQAISELELPDEPAPSAKVAPTEVHLTDEHGIMWFISHCTWSARFKLAGTILTGIGIVFFAGFRLGAIESVRNLYIQWENSLKAQPSPNPTQAQPKK
jgi:hypothetical protein